MRPNEAESASPSTENERMISILTASVIQTAREPILWWADSDLRSCGCWIRSYSEKAPGPREPSLVCPRHAEEVRQCVCPCHDLSTHQDNVHPRGRCGDHPDGVFFPPGGSDA